MQPSAKLEADNQLNFAMNLEDYGDFEGAKQSYLLAADMYSSFAEPHGRLACHSGLARTAWMESDSTAFYLHKHKMELLINETAPQLSYYLLMLNIFKLQQTGDYYTISNITIPSQDLPVAEKLQLTTAKLQAESYLRTASNSSAIALKKLAQKYQKLFNKGKEADYEPLSSAWYALAYHYYIQRDYATAIKYLDTVCDWDYRYGNFSALGHALWLKGQVLAANNNTGGALASFRRAESIFSTTRDSTSLQAVQSEISKLKGGKP